MARSRRGRDAIERIARDLLDHERDPALREGRARLSLAAMRRMVRRMGDPLRGIAVVHVAGSKGKGSVCHLAESLLRAQGLRTGLYVSPHVDSWNERVQIGGVPIAPDALARDLAAMVRLATRGGAPPPTLFEALTGAALRAFRRARVQVAVIEVGIGGRLDATNVVRSDVAVVTALEREHVAVLGRTLAEIAAEKGGILKGGAAAVSGIPPRSPAAAVLRRAARAGRCDLWEWGRALSVRRRPGSIVVRLRGHGDVRLPVPDGGPFAARNAALALAAVARLAARRPDLDIELDPARLAAGVRRARIPARLEEIAQRPRTWRDGAHTPRSLAAAARAVARLAGRAPVIVLALKADKPLARCVGALAGRCGALVATCVPGGRGHPAPALVAAARAHGIMSRRLDDPLAAVALARNLAGADGAVLVTGSFWLAGAIAGRRQRWAPESSITSSITCSSPTASW